MVPQELQYTAEHEWIAELDGDSTGARVVRVGVTDFAQQQLGDVVFVQLPTAGEQVSAGQGIGEVESTKSVSDVYAPLSGEVAEINGQLEDQPELINSDPYGEGWIMTLRLADDPGGETMSPEAYQQLTEQS